MKKRLLSTLLFVVMVMTLLPASAFAAQGTVVSGDSRQEEISSSLSSEPDESEAKTGSRKISARSTESKDGNLDVKDETVGTLPEGTQIVSAHFYADAGLAEKAIQDIIDSLAHETSDNKIEYTWVQGEEEPDIPEGKNCVNNTLVVRYALDSGTDYALAIGVDNDEKKTKVFNLPVENRKIKNSAANARNLKEYLFIYHIPEKVEASTYTVELGIADAKNSPALDSSSDTVTKKIPLVETVIDFGALSVNEESKVPEISDIIESDSYDGNNFYTATQEQKKNNQITVIADTTLYEDSDTDDKRLRKLIRFKEDENFSSDESGEWIYTPAPSNLNNNDSFVWRYNLPAKNISAAEENDKLYIIKNNVVTNQLFANSTNKIQLQPENQLQRSLKAVATGVSPENGYWIGFKVEAPENATKIKWNYGDENVSFQNAHVTEITNDNETITFYVNAFPTTSQQQYPYFLIQFLARNNDNDVELTRPYKIHVDLSMVAPNDTIIPDETEIGADNVVTVTVAENEKVKEQIRLSATSKKIVIDATAETASPTGIRVKFSGEVATLLNQITTTDVEIVLKVPYGTLTIPQQLLSKIFRSAASSRSAADGPEIAITNLGTNLYKQWFIMDYVENWKIDAYWVQILDAKGQEIDLGSDAKMKLTLSNFQRVKEVPTNDSVWALKLDKSGNTYPKILSQEAECKTGDDKKTLQTVTFEIGESGWYAIALKSFVNDQMILFEDDNKIQLFAKNGNSEELIKLENGTNTLSTFDPKITAYTAVTTADKVIIKSDQTYARYENAEGVSLDTANGVCEFTLSKVYNPITIKIGSKAYTITITKKPATNSLLLQRVQLIGNAERPNICRIKIVGAASNRMYLIQQTRLLQTGAAITANAIVESDENGDAYFYAGYPTSDSVKIAVKVYEINEKADSPFVETTGLINCNYKDGVDRVIGVAASDSDVNDSGLVYGKNVKTIQSVQGQ